MNDNYGRDLDLNLLRILLVVAETGSVTAAASRLYLTQPAVSAALSRLARAVGAPLFMRSGRGIALTARGARLVRAARPHLEALVGAALSPGAFDPRTAERHVRLGLSDANEEWLLPPLLRVMANEAPCMRILVVPVQFRTLSARFASGEIDLAVTVAEDVPAGTRREELFHGGFVCLFDPRHARLGSKLTLAEYLARHHVVVSYNGDFRGIVEDFLGHTRRVRISVPSFQSVAAAVNGTGLLATVPESFARQLLSTHPHLRATSLPFSLTGTPMELLWRAATDDDEALRFVREHILGIGREMQRGSRSRRRVRAKG